jgi:hypothetical protein
MQPRTSIAGASSTNALPDAPTIGSQLAPVLRPGGNGASAELNTSGRFSRIEREGFHWRRALEESATFLVIEQA